MGARNSHTDFYVGLLRATVCDVSAALGEPFDSKNLARDVSTLEARFASEGIGFVTKVLPRLGKHFDHALEVYSSRPLRVLKPRKVGLHRDFSRHCSTVSSIRAVLSAKTLILMLLKAFGKCASVSTNSSFHLNPLRVQLF